LARICITRVSGFIRAAQVAIVTGGASGIGEVLALLISEEGATVIVAADIQAGKPEPARFVQARAPPSGDNVRAGWNSLHAESQSGAVS
jgi:NAD(P)-dependent dehydrogenase (short-subunit alcohol dehydrogenase family)